MFKNINLDPILVTGDDIVGDGDLWLMNVWEKAESMIKITKKSECLLITDEIQKITNWSENIKK